MKNCLLPFTLLLLLVTRVAAVNDEEDKNKNTDGAKDPKTCNENTQEVSKPGSAYLTYPLHHASPISTQDGARLVLHILRPSPGSYSPHSLHYTSGAPQLLSHWETTSTGAPKNLTFQESSYRFHVTFKEGNKEAQPEGRFQVKNYLVRMVDAAGNLTAQPPAYIELLTGEGTLYRYDATSGQFGRYIHRVTPNGRTETPADAGFERLYGSEGELRQVLAPSRLADIVVTGPESYEIRMYVPGDLKPDKVNGLYEPKPGKEPFVVYTLSNPASGSFTQLRSLKKQINGLQKQSDFTYDNATGQWNLEQHDENGEPVKEHKLELMDAEGERKWIREWISKDDVPGLFENILLEQIKLNGEWVRERLVQDPDGLALTTTYSYYTLNSEPHRVRRLRTQTNPDGSWIARDYDLFGRVSLELRPWLDGPATAPADPQAAANLADATLYDFTPHTPEDFPLPHDQRPRTVTRQILGQTVSKTFYVYGTDPVTNARYDIVERAATPNSSYGDPGKLTSRTDYFAPSEPDWKQGRIQTQTSPDGQRTTYDYERMAWDEIDSEYKANPAGNALRTIITRGTTANPKGITNETTRTVSLQNESGHSIRNETYVFIGSDTYDLISWETRTYDVYGQLTQTVNSRGETTSYVKRASCCGADEVTNAQGITTKTEHDGLERVIERIKLHPTDSDKDLLSEYTLDPAGRTLIEITRDRANTLTLMSTYQYDGIGRRTHSFPHTGGNSSVVYDDLNRITTQTNPDGSTVITERYLDGRTKSVTGTGTTHQFYEYGVNPDGSQWSKVYTGPAYTASPMWSKSTTNMLGQSIFSERPGYDGTILVSGMYYNDKGQLERSTPAVGASTLYAYDELGDQGMVVLDVNNEGIAFFTEIENDPSKLDGEERITESESAYVKIGADWWMESKSYIYDDGNATPTLTGTSRQRITGLGGIVSGKGTLVGESVSIDIHGNESWSRRYLDRDNQTALSEQDSSLTTASPDAKTTNVNGLTTQTDNREPETGNWLTTTFDYDALERRLGSTDPRTGRSFVTYVTGKNLIDKQTDAAGNETLFTYYPETDRRKSVEDPNGNITTTAYTEDGQVAANWGASYPVVYQYDAYDRMVYLQTLRDPNHTFTPSVDQMTGIYSTANRQLETVNFDTTQWIYEESTGLLTDKIYDEIEDPTDPPNLINPTVSYTYTPDGRLETRTWARTTDNQPPTTGNLLITTYTYHPNTLELHTTVYSDGTPTITNTYDRLGRMEETLDAFGTKTYAYNGNLQPKTETWTGLVTNTVTRVYKTDGRPEGFNLSTGYNIEYGYSASTGSFDTLTYTNTVSAVSHTADYAYVANSGMIEGYTLGDFERTVAYETNRNLVSTITNTWNTATTVSAFDYTNDDAGRRTNRDDSGTAFSSTQANVFGYNARNEVTSATMKNGNSTYNFDQIGNRTTISTPDLVAPIDYTTNALNQYTSVSFVPSVVPTYDLDGNMTSDGDGKTLTWNGENRLIKFEEGNTTVENTYDGQGRRVRKLVKDLGTVTHDIRYMYEGWNLLYEMDVATGSPTRRYVWGLDLSQSMQGAGGVGGLLFTESNGTSHAVSYDANGNISEYIDLADGSIDAHLEYDAFGRTIASTGTAPSAFGFSTKYLDEESGWYYYGFRYYDPETGRWPNRDPIGERGGLNIYVFSENNAINKLDKIGLETVTFIAITFIPQEYITDPLGTPFKGDGQPNNKSIDRKDYRTWQKITVSLDDIPFSLNADTVIKSIIDQKRDTGLSIRYRRVGTFDKLDVPNVIINGLIYEADQEIQQKPEKTSNFKVTGDIVLRKTEGNLSEVCELNFSMIGNGKNPAVGLGPSINYKYDFQYRIGKGWKVKGQHDGFPSYLLFKNEKLIHDYSAVGESPLSLFGDSDESFEWKDI